MNASLDLQPAFSAMTWDHELFSGPLERLVLDKGGGYSDLEYALAFAAGRLSDDIPILTTVHSLQRIEEAIPRDVHDIPVDLIVTPQEVIETHTSLPRPEGIYWKLLPPEKIEAIPALRKMADHLPSLL